MTDAGREREERFHNAEKRALRILVDGCEKAFDPLWEHDTAPMVIDAMLMYLVNRYGFALSIGRRQEAPAQWERWYHGEPKKADA